MKTLLDIDPKLLKKAQKTAGTKTKKETVTYALLELLRTKKRASLKNLIGKYQHGMSLKELLRLRTQS